MKILLYKPYLLYNKYCLKSIRITPLKASKFAFKFYPNLIPINKEFSISFLGRFSQMMNHTYNWKIYSFPPPSEFLLFQLPVSSFCATFFLVDWKSSISKVLFLM